MIEIPVPPDMASDIEPLKKAWLNMDCEILLNGLEITDFDQILFSIAERVTIGFYNEEQQIFFLMKYV